MERIELAAEILASKPQVAVLTGAGVSAESGVPTFRGAGGLWRGMSAEALASVEGFERNPELVLSWYKARRDMLRPLKPNAGHHALVQLETQCQYFHLITQNVDNLHRLAGSAALTELHGNLWIDRCHRCDWTIRLSPEKPLEPLSRCPECGGYRRPGVVWFGELLPQDAFNSATKSVKQADVLLVVGTSAAVYPAAGLISLARQFHKTIIEVNLEESQASDLCDLSLLGKSATLLPQIVNAMQKRMTKETN